MYLRFVRVAIDEARLREAQSFYEGTVVPALQAAGGCSLVGLLRPISFSDELFSMTLWESHEQAWAWEQSAAYRQLLGDWESTVARQDEKRVRLDQQVSDGGRDSAGIHSEGFTLEAGEETLTVEELSSRPFLRIVSLRVREGRWDELVTLYEEQVLPALMETKGCRAAILAEGLEDPDRGISLSIWDREEDAIRYELSGTFDSLTRKLRDTLTTTRQWQAALTSEGTAAGTPPREGYLVIVGQRL